MIVNYINKALVKLFFVSVLISFLTACAGSWLPRVKPTDALEPDKGFIIIRIVNNEDFLGYNFNRSWHQLSIRLKTNEEDNTFKLSPAYLQTTRSTQIFTGQLPQGTYDLLELRLTSGQGNVTYYYWLPLGKLGTFKVVPGHITNLGTIICQPLGGRRYQFIHTNIDNEVQELLESNYPVIYKG